MKVDWRFFCCLFLLLSVVRAYGGEEEDIERDLRETNEASMRGDYTKSVGKMYPPVVNAFGGAAEVLRQIQAVMTPEAFKLINYDGYETKKPYFFSRGVDKLYAVIPYKSFMVVAGSPHMESGYEIGIKPDGSAEWYYVNANMMQANLFQRFFSDFPKQLYFALPEHVSTPSSDID